jgi:hypothetical protein
MELESARGNAARNNEAFPVGAGWRECGRRFERKHHSSLSLATPMA